MQVVAVRVGHRPGPGSGAGASPADADRRGTRLPPFPGRAASSNFIASKPGKHRDAAASLKTRAGSELSSSTRSTESWRGTAARRALVLWCGVYCKAVYLYTARALALTPSLPQYPIGR